MNKHPLANCEKCPLKDKEHIPTTNLNVGLCIVNEVPGNTNDLLFSTLKKVDIQVSDVCSTSLVSCKGLVNKAAIDACSKRLQDEIKDKKVLLLGAPVVKAFGIESNIKELVGN